MELDKAIKERKSVKKFSNKKPDWRNIIEAIDMARYSPMAGNLFSLKFIVIDDEKKIQKIAEACQQDFILDAQYLVVVCSDPFKTTQSYEERSERYLRQQAGAGMQNFLLKLIDLGLSTCWVGHFVDKQIKNALEIPEEINIEAIFPIGYESKMSKAKNKKRIDIDSILYFNKYKNKKMESGKRLFG